MLNKEPFDTFVTGDGNDRALIWKIEKVEENKEEQKEE